MDSAGALSIAIGETLPRLIADAHDHVVARDHVLIEDAELTDEAVLRALSQPAMPDRARWSVADHGGDRSHQAGVSRNNLT